MTDVLAELTEEQRAAATVLRGPLLITAGPGSGKTRTITHRIAYGIQTGTFDPFKTLALTFTTKAAGELNRRLASLGAPDVAARTFHSAALRQLRHFWPEVVGGRLPTLESQRSNLIAAAIQRCGYPQDSDTVADVTTELDWLKGRCLPLADYETAATGRPLPWGRAAHVSAVLAAYEAEKSERAVIDFDDVLLILIGLLDSHSSVRETVRRTYRTFTVDEYQDVSRLQQRLLDLWVGERQELCVVGDPAQSIYEFAGADPTLLTTFPQRYPNAQVVALSATYRCSAVVTEVVNTLAREIPHSVRLASAAKTKGSVQVLRFPTDDAEARGLADEIAGLVAGGADPADIAVLVRTNHQIHRFERELQRRQIPYATRGSERFFSRPEVRESVTRLRGLARGATQQSAQAAGDVWHAMGHGDEPPLDAKQRLRWESLAALAAWFAARSQEPLLSVIADLDHRIAHNDPPEPAGVALMTLHAAKGLEWDTVFVAGAWSGMLPYVRAGSDRATRADLTEERRLAYVGFSRAERRLVVSYGAHTSGGARRDPSPYIAEAVEPMAGAHSTSPAPAGHRQIVLPAAVDSPGLQGQQHTPARCRMCGQALVTGSERVLGRCRRCPALPDPALLEDLHAWRAVVARRQTAPTYMVLTDATLLAIAELEPATLAELATIPGVTDEKLAAFGDEILGLTRPRRVSRRTPESTAPLQP